MNQNKLQKEILRTFDSEISALQQLRERIAGKYAENYTRAVELIARSNKIVVTGVGKSGIIAKKIAATFSSIGVSAVFLHPVEALHGDIGIVRKDDTAILLSKSGSTDEIVKLVPYLKMQGASIISLTGNSNSFLARSADIFLDAAVEKEACKYNLAPTSSTTAALVAGDSLAIAVMEARGVTLENFSRLHPLGQIGRNITVQVKDIMHSGDNMPKAELGTPLQKAVISITEKGLGCIGITDKTGKLAGLITDGDLRRALQKDIDIRSLKVDDIMTRGPVTCSENAYLGETLAIMEQRERQINILPVVDKSENLKGIVRIHDIIKSGM